MTDAFRNRKHTEHKHKKELKRREIRRHKRNHPDDKQARFNKLRSHPAQLNDGKDELRLKMPTNICVYSADDSFALLVSMKEMELKAKENPNKSILLDFGPTETISVSGAIVIKACFEKLQFDYPDRSLSIYVPQKQQKVRQIVQYIGLRDEKLEIDHSDISRWFVQAYNVKKSKNNLMEEIDKPIHELTGWKDQTDEKRHILEAIPEACWNSFEHGYLVNAPSNKKLSPNSFKKAYLIFGATERDYTFCIFDRGIGFRGSFQYYHHDVFKSFLTVISKMSKAKQEQKIIEEAIENGSRAYGLSRGSGLPAILKSVTESLKGHLMIHSLSGYYQNGKGPKKQSRVRENIQGTLVQFTIPRAQKQEGDNHE